MSRLSKNIFQLAFEVSKYLSGKAQQIAKSRGGRVFAQALLGLDTFEKVLSS